MQKIISTPVVIDNAYKSKDVMVPANEWISVPPYAIIRDVFLVDYSGRVTFGWVGSRVVPDEHGVCTIGELYGGDGGLPVARYMIIPMPFEDPTGWHFEDNEDDPIGPKKKKQYCIAIERKSPYGTTYEFRLAYYEPSTHYDWIGFDRRDANVSVIAWRAIPKIEYMDLFVQKSEVLYS